MSRDTQTDSSRDGSGQDTSSGEQIDVRPPTIWEQKKARQQAGEDAFLIDTRGAADVGPAGD